MLRAVSAALAGVSALLLALFGKVHAYAVLPIVSWVEGLLNQGEESSKAFIREAFGVFNRILNGSVAWLLSVLDRSYAETQRRAWASQQAFTNWWREDRTSTLNAVVANAQQPGVQHPGACCAPQCIHACMDAGLDAHTLSRTHTRNHSHEVEHGRACTVCCSAGPRHGHTALCK